MNLSSEVRRVRHSSKNNEKTIKKNSSFREKYIVLKFEFNFFACEW